MGKIRIILVDDHTILREGLKAMLSRVEDLEIVGEAGDGWDAVALAQHLEPDVVIMDLAMPGMDGLEATRRIVKICPKTRVLVLSQHDNERYIVPVLNAGAMGYVLKRSVGAELLSAIRAAHRGECIVPESVAEMLERGAPHAASETAAADDLLTEREKEILKLVAEGRTNQEIAELLALSKKTVMCHRANIYQKLGTHNRTELIKYALRLRLVELTPE
jgi:DNA-binding NarL/FixJ family response regulator